MIATPGKELANQIMSVTENLIFNLDIKAKLHITKHQPRGDKPMEAKNVDLLIGSFGCLRNIFEEKIYDRRTVRHVIFDEADSLLDDTFNEESVPFLQKFSAVKGGAQMTLVGATFPTSLNRILSEVVNADDLLKITTPNLHRNLSHIHQKFIRVAEIGKEKLLLDLIAEDISKKRQTIIFSNKSSTAIFVHKFLKRNGIESASFHAEVRSHQRQSELERFLRGEVQVISCSDLASRGIDTFNASHVINYDFPFNISDYIHRVGRVGRVSSPIQGGNKVTNFVRRGVQARLVQQIEESVRTNTEIPNVNSNIIRILQHRRRKYLERTGQLQDTEEFEESGP